MQCFGLHAYSILHLP
ncbi:truncated Rh158 [macacine betaherpesvirus 3]|nr:truncated Rh158 [macacine betaherpesvirus 3]